MISDKDVKLIEHNYCGVMKINAALIVESDHESDCDLESVKVARKECLGKIHQKVYGDVERKLGMIDHAFRNHQTELVKIRIEELMEMLRCGGMNKGSK